MPKITVTVTPASGEPKSVEVEATGATLGEVLKAAGLTDSRMKLTINGNAASSSDHVPDGAKVTLTERPSGS